MKEITFTPSNVCSRKMTVRYDEDGTILDVFVEGGCQGNLAGICSLVKGMKINQVIEKLEGIKCRGSRTRETSCPDQLALGLKNNI